MNDVRPRPAAPRSAPAALPPDTDAAWLGAWADSSRDLQRGLEVHEHDWPAGGEEAEPLLAALSFA